MRGPSPVIPPLRAETTSVGVFDFRTSLQPLADPSLLKKEFRFLASPALYEAAQGSGAALPGGIHFAVRPLTPGQLRFNHFWRDYVGRALLPRGEPHARWTLQVPLFCRPLYPEPAIAPGALDGVPATVHVRVLLWPFGWSTLVTVDLARPADLDTLRELVGRIRREAVFETGGAGVRLTLSEVFRETGRRMQEDLFEPRAVSPTLVLSRHWVVGLRSLPVPFTYGADVDPDRPSFSLGDRCRLHGVLRGEEVSRSRLDVLEGRDGAGRKFTLVPLERAGFTITDFDYGTLVFLHEEPGSRRARNAWHCLGANLRTCSLVAEALRLGAVECARANPAALPAVAAVGEAARESLRGLPHRYPTAFCSAFVRRGSG